MRQFIPANAPVTVYAPASMGNVGVGFDLLGAALAPIDGSLLGDTVTVGPAPCGVSLTQLGPWAHKLPQEPQQNIVYRCAEFFLGEAGINQGVSLTCPRTCRLAVVLAPVPVQWWRRSMVSMSISAVPMMSRPCWG